MKITEKHIKVLKAAQGFSEGKTQGTFNRQDAEECIDMGLVEPAAGYPLTENGKKALREHRS